MKYQMGALFFSLPELWSQAGEGDFDLREVTLSYENKIGCTGTLISICKRKRQ